ncbi:MAG: endonuclease [Planctomycetaceae bacterium]|nr:endonuclease [Planctomycetaceae bacterium]|tara:strand:+ start:518 stop:811 length:294 start_codon:yes stop_codon:yes gene_type:complete
MSQASSDISDSTEDSRGWFVYILQCADGTLYTGMTNDLPRRIEQHNAGTAARYTRARTPVELVYQQETANRSSALKREYAIKQLTRKQKDRLIAEQS